MNINELEQKVIDAAQAYYEGFPIMNDASFDALVEYLEAAKPESKLLRQTGWGYDPYKNVGTKINHKYGQVFGIDRKPRKIEDIPDTFNNEDVMLSAKLDGLSMICYFMNGKFVKALTRGNGITGIDRTDKVSEILAKELQLPDDFDFTGAIRGEVCISNENWNKMISLGLEGSNQRNTATGIINKDKIEDDIKYVDLVFYKVIGLDDYKTYTYNNLYKTYSIYNYNFDVHFLSEFIKPEYIVNYQLTNMNNVTQEYLEKLFNVFNNKYPCDGIVITKNNKIVEDVDDKTFKRLAIYNDEIAYKFLTETATTTIKEIKWKMSKGNKAIPTINVEPVELSGATVQNATAYNAKYIYDNNLDTGAVVTLIRSGEVIPCILDVVQGVEGVKENLDNMTCPYCGNKLEWDSVNLVCKNSECSNRDNKNLLTWVNTLGVVDGMSETLIFKFFNELNINSLEDLYNSNYNDLSYSDVVSNTHKGKFNSVLYKLYNDKINFESILVALNINMIGPKNAKKLSSNDDFVNSILNYINDDNTEQLIEKLSKLTDIAGPAIINSICSIDGLSKLKNIKYVKDRLVFNDKNSTSDNKIKVVITGKLSVSRKEFEKYLNDNGYELASGISKSVQYLITDNPNSGSSKNVQADKLGISKLTENEFRNLIENK